MTDESNTPASNPKAPMQATEIGSWLHKGNDTLFKVIGVVGLVSFLIASTVSGYRVHLNRRIERTHSELAAAVSRGDDSAIRNLAAQFLHLSDTQRDQTLRREAATAWETALWRQMASASGPTLTLLAQEARELKLATAEKREE